jgi:RNA polymerase sigma-70 factor, ECF subfamily
MTPPAHFDARSLFLRFTKGDEAAFDLIFREYHPALCAFAHNILRDAASAEDCVQDVFVKLWVDRKTISLPQSPKAYLYAAVRNCALNKIGRSAVRQAWEEGERDAPELTMGSLPAPDMDLLRSESKAGLAAAFEALTPRSRTALTLRWYEEMSYAEIALAMGISEKSVENQLARGLKSLRDHIGA